MEVMILCLKGLFDLGALHLDDIWTKIRLFLSPFLISTQNWRVFWFDELGLFRGHYGDLGNLSVMFKLEM